MKACISLRKGEEILQVKTGARRIKLGRDRDYEERQLKLGDTWGLTWKPSAVKTSWNL